MGYTIHILSCLDGDHALACASGAVALDGDEHMNKSHENNLSAERARFLFDYEPATGHLAWRNPTARRIRPGHIAGTRAANGLRYVSIQQQIFSAHRLVWLIVHGAWPKQNLSAKNGDYSDLRIENFVETTAVQTTRNARRGSNNTSGVRGVSYAKNVAKWRAEITRNRQKVLLGYFATLAEAQSAYASAAANLEMPQLSPEEYERRKALARKDTLRRSLWRRLVRQNGPPIGWNSFAQFAKNVGDAVFPHAQVVAVRETEPIGPNNFRVEPRAKIDRSTYEGKLAYQRERRVANKDRYKNHELQNTFGITLEQHRAMVLAQNGVCAVCKLPETWSSKAGKLRSLSVDHNHTTGQVRDLLCHGCNNGIGFFQESPAALRAAADYLERHAAQSASVPASNVIPLKQKER